MTDIVGELDAVVAAHEKMLTTLEGAVADAKLTDPRLQAIVDRIKGHTERLTNLVMQLPIRP